MVPGVRLLVVDEQVEDVVLAALRGEGFAVRVAGRATDALVEFGCFAPDALLVAPWMPDLDAGDLVAAIRRNGDQPILLGLGDADDVAAVGPALIAGATATVSRPYDAREVAAKVTTTLPHAPARSPLRLGPLVLDPLAHTVHLAGTELPGIGLKEFRLLELLLSRADRVVSHREVRDALWEGGTTPPTSNAITVHVRRLRARLPEPVQLRTVRGLGYRLTLVPARPPVTGTGAGAAARR